MISRPIYTEKLLKRVGENVAVARKRRGWTQDSLAERAMVGSSTIKRLERGTSIGLDAFMSIIVALDLEENFLNSVSPNNDERGLMLAEREISNRKRVRESADNGIDTNF